MTDENPTEEMEPAQQEVVSPGQRLREAREEKGLTIQEVASQLRLQQRLIEALEADNEAALPPATFVSGYLRSYAKLLDIPEDSVVPPSKSESPPPLVVNIANKGEASSRDWPARLITYLIIAAIVVSVAMWLFSKKNTNEEPVAVAKPEVMEQGGSVNLALPESESPATTAADEATPAAGTEAAPEGAAAPTGNAAAGADESASAAQAQPEEAPAQATGSTPLTDATPQSKLELRYQADSWTEITDNAGRQLRYGLVKAGEDLVLHGEAPFRVFLGYAPGVTVYYNGELFDHSPFRRRDVARFRVGRAEHNHPGSR